MIVTTILVPVLAGLFLLVVPAWKGRKVLCGYTGLFLVLTGILAAAALSVTEDNTPLAVCYLTRGLLILFKLDGIGRFFAVITTVVWLLVGLFSFVYMTHEKEEKRYYGFYLLVYGILLGMEFAGNLITFYLFYELLTLAVLPLILHAGTREAVLAGQKYLFFSLAGAYMVLFGIYCLNRYANTLTFTAGGVLDRTLLGGREELLLAAAFLMLAGFGVKAGLFPMHTWLTAAHPEAPVPASAALSGILVKAGVLGSIRTVYYLFGPAFIRGTWVQEAWLLLIILTILMGSVLACREKALKKRLAYSTVSQVSYVLLGLAMLTPEGVTGALLHTGAHAFMKSGLFLIAGAVFYQTGKTRVDELAGIGKSMPVTMLCFTLLALSLIGIPPLAGFVSKWYLGMGSVSSGTAVFDILGAAVLLVSALFTAGYLLPVAIRGFLPGEAWEGAAGHCKAKAGIKEAPVLMLAAIIALTALAVLGGIFPGRAISFVEGMGTVVLEEVSG